MAKNKFLVVILVLCVTQLFFSVDAQVTWKSTLTPGVNYFGRGSATGDLNHDSYQDILVLSGVEGKVYVYFGGETNDYTEDITFYAETHSTNALGYYGMSVSVGDINNDGIDDFLISDPVVNSGAGIVSIFYGPILAGTYNLTDADETFIGNLTTNKIPGILTTVCDINGDNYQDTILVTSTSSGATSSNIHVYEGEEDTEISLSEPSYTVTAPNTNNLSWYSYRDCFDWNTDGINDFFVGDVIYDTGHGLFGVMGSRAQLSFYQILFSPLQSDISFTYQNTGSHGDINIDGYDDMCIGSPLDSTNGTKAGKIECLINDGSYTSGTYVFDNEATYTFYGEEENDCLGRSSYMDDINNDGYPELLVGANEQYKSAGERDGKVYIYKNNNGVIGDSPWYVLNPIISNSGFGYQVYTFDWDNDGFLDILSTHKPSGEPLKYSFSVYEVTHGEVEITLDNTTDYIKNQRLTGLAEDTEETTIISGVEWGLYNDPRQIWTSCTAEDGSFNSSAERFNCDLSDLPEGNSTIYIRTYDEHEVYTPRGYYFSTGEVTLDSKSSDLLTLGVDKNDLTKPGIRTMMTPERRLKLYFAVDEDTTQVAHIKISEHHDFRGDDWRGYDKSKTFTLSPGDETKKLYLKLKDLAGNVSDTYIQKIKLDTTPPNLELTSIGNINYEEGVYNYYEYTDPRPVFRGTTEQGSEVRLYVDGKYYGEDEHVDDEDVWEINLKDKGLSIPVGRHEIMFEGEDKAGNTVKSSLILIML